MDTLNMMRRVTAPTDVGGGPTVEDVRECCDEIDRLRAKNERLTQERDDADLGFNRAQKDLDAARVEVEHERKRAALFRAQRDEAEEAANNNASTAERFERERDAARAEVERVRSQRDAKDRTCADYWRRIDCLTAEVAALRERERWVPVVERLPDARDLVEMCEGRRRAYGQLLSQDGRFIDDHADEWRPEFWRALAPLPALTPASEPEKEER